MVVLLDFGNMFLTVSLYLMFVLCSSTQRDQEVGRYMTIANIGIKMCQTRCVEQGGCASFEYDFKSLVCRLPNCNAISITGEPGSMRLLKDQTQVFTGCCDSISCRLGLLCLKTRSGKAACVKGRKQFSSKRCLKWAMKSKDVQKKLFAACCEGDLCQVRNILAERKVDINNTAGKYNTSPVMVAAYEGHGDVFDFLVSKGCDLSHVDTKGNNILHMACTGGDIETVRYILSHGNIDVDSRGGYFGWTPLMHAAHSGHEKVFELLVERGGNVSLRDTNGDNILHVLSYRGHLEMVKYVLTQNTLDINGRGGHGRTPLMKAAWHGQREVFELLMERGGNVSFLAPLGSNVLHIACIGGNIATVKYILSLGKVDIDSRGHRGRTPLMIAADKGKTQLFNLLLHRGGDVFLVDEEGDNALHIACSKGDIEMVKYVLALNTLDINMRGRHGRTPLMHAAYYGHGKLFKLLVKRGGNASLVDLQGNNILHMACNGGNIATVKYILSLGKVDIDSRGQKGRTPLMIAADKGKTQVFKLLVDRGGDVFLVDEELDNVLHFACFRGDIEMVKYVLALNTLDINMRGRHGRTPLMHAAYSGHGKLFELLVKRGGNASLVDLQGNNILHMACIGGNIATVKYILSLGKVDIDSRGQKGRTPLMIAAFKRKKQVFKLLVDRGGDVFLVDEEGDNALHIACSKGDIEMVKYVLALNTLDINMRGRHGRTPLMHAAYYGHGKLFELLVKRGGNASLVDLQGNNILHMACNGGNIATVKYVLSLGKVDIDSRGHKGRTPLMLAADKGKKQVFKLLVHRGGDVFLVDEEGDNALHIACSKGDIEMVKYVLALNTLDINMRGRHGRTPLMHAAYYGHGKLFELLVKRGGNASLVDLQGNNILHMACNGGNIATVKYILSLGKVDIDSRGHKGRTPLMLAADKGKTQLFNLLVHRGGDVFLIDEGGDNVLHIACSRGDIEMVKYVLALNTLDINMRGRHGRTPLMHAAYSGREKVFELLVERGADVSLKDPNGVDILNIACFGGNSKMVKYLLSQETWDINRMRGKGCTKQL